MSVYLLGGAELSEPYAELDRRLIAAADGAPITLIPTAAAYERPEKRIATAEERATALGTSVDVVPVYTRADALDTDLAERVRSARLIYLVDGSTMHVESVWKRSEFWTALVDAADAGATIVASGASGRAMCDPMVDPRGGAFAVGLGLITGTAFVPRTAMWTDDRERRTRSLLPAGVELVVVEPGDYLEVNR